jgi:hypothetical protein
MNDLQLATDPSRSHWQRSTSPLLLAEVDRLLAVLSVKGVPLSPESCLKEMIIPLDADNNDIVTSAIVVHACLRARRAGLPLYVLDAEAAVALANTELAEEEALGSLRLPHEGFYISLPPGLFSMEDSRSGQHSLEGIWVCYADVSEWAAGPGVTPGTCVQVVLIGRAKGSRESWAGFMEPEDSIRHVFLGPWSVPSVIFRQAVDRQSTQLVCNLLWALENGYLKAERVTPLVPKSPGKRKVQERKGYGLRPYTVIHLAERAKKAAAEREAGAAAEGGSVRAHLVRGFWNRYWVLAPDGPTYAEKTRPDGVVLHQVRRWIPPMKRGSGETPESKQYKVRM